MAIITIEELLALASFQAGRCDYVITGHPYLTWSCQQERFYSRLSSIKRPAIPARNEQDEDTGGDSNDALWV